MSCDALAQERQGSIAGTRRLRPRLVTGGPRSLAMYLQTVLRFIPSWRAMAVTDRPGRCRSYRSGRTAPRRASWGLSGHRRRGCGPPPRRSLSSTSERAICGPASSYSDIPSWRAPRAISASGSMMLSSCPSRRISDAKRDGYCRCVRLGERPDTAKEGGQRSGRLRARPRLKRPLTPVQSLAASHASISQRSLRRVGLRIEQADRMFRSRLQRHGSRQSGCFGKRVDVGVANSIVVTAIRASAPRSITRPRPRRI